MTPADLQKFTQAISQAQAGKKAEAHSIFIQLASLYPDEPKLLLWLAFTASDLEIARTSLDKLARLAPSDPALPGARGWLAAEEAKQVVVPVYTGNGASISTVVPRQPAQPVEAAPDDLRSQLNGTVGQKKSAAEPTAENTRRRRVLTILLIASPLVIIVALAIVFFPRSPDLSGLLHGTPTPDDKDRVAAAGLPVYDGAERLYLTAADRSRFNSTYSQSLKLALPPNATINATSLESYTTKDAIGRVFNFYSTRLKDWNSLSALENARSYRKTDKALIVANIPLVKLDLLAYNLTTSDSVFVVMEIDFR